MAELIKPWSDGGNLSVAYDGDRDGEAIFSSEVNEGIDREMIITIKDTSNSVYIEKRVSQQGKREVFTDDWVLADGETFNVLKDEL
jgi:hypothetical protein